MRKLASIQQIAEVKSISGADRICAYKVKEWWVVDQVGRYSVGDLVVYFEIDSFLPNSIATFLTKADHQPSEYLGIKGERLRTVRLKKQLSQGLILPLSVIPPNELEWTDPIDTDVTDLLGVVKWEAPVSAQLQGQARGSFPSKIIKTDQERVQNLHNLREFDGMKFEVTEKLEGSSMTVFVDDGVYGVCSRNINLKTDDDNSFSNYAREHNLESKLMQVYKSGTFAIQGELIGPGIQKNIYNLSSHEFFVFDIQVNGSYLTPTERQIVCSRIGLKHTPVIDDEFIMNGQTTDQLLEMAEGHSKLFKTQREGLVFKAHDDERISFKAVSNSYLLKNQ